MEQINLEFEKCLAKGDQEFVNWCKRVFNDIDENPDIQEIEGLAIKIAQNMFLYECNIEVAKTDYIALITLLINKGILFKHIK